MRAPTLSVILTLTTLAAAAVVPACSWSRFDDLTKDGPVVYLDRPDAVSSQFGASAAGDGGALLVGGQPGITGAAIFRVDEQPSSAALTTVCGDQGRCRLVAQPAAAGDVSGGQHCFLYGVGLGDASLGDAYGVLGSCADGVAYKLPVPAAIASKVIKPLFDPLAPSGFSGILSVTSSGGRVVAASPDVGLAWTYANGMPVESPRPAGADGSYGMTVASTGALVAISSPASGKVFVFDAADTGLTLRGCVSGPAPWGVVMRATTDGARALLAVSDALTTVDVLDLAAIKGDGTSCAAPGAELVTTLRCAESEDGKGCDGAAFGYSLAFGDLDGDGDAELLVGAPGLNMRKKPNGGAVFVFDLEGDPVPKDTLFLSSAEAEDRLGTSVAAVRVGARDVVATGVPGQKRSAALFFCSALGGASVGPRCQ